MRMWGWLPTDVVRGRGLLVFFGIFSATDDKTLFLFLMCA